jgi:Flp pilus assembly protein TadG
MLSPLIRRARKNENNDARSKQSGVTIAMVAVSMVVIIGMAALSIDVGTLYQAKAEAQRAADAAALAAARVISISGVTGDPNTASTWQTTCGTTGTATLAATAVAQAQWNFVGRVAAPTVRVTYGPGAGSNDCSTLAGPGSTFSVNPTVTVYVQQANLPTFFARVFSLITNGTSSNSGVSATATAEVYNPSGSGSLASGMVPVQPRCVKPLIIPNIDPQHPAAGGFVSTAGAINSQGTWESSNGVIGETFTMYADCKPGAVDCLVTDGNILDNPPKYNSAKLPLTYQPNLEYVPALVQNTSGAVPSCSAEGNWTGSNFQQAIAGCDQTTVYACGTPAPAGGTVDLTENPVTPAAITGDTATGVACLTNSTVGPDVLTPATYPFQITAGTGNPLSAQGVTGFITTSNSIATIPIYDTTLPALAGPQPPVTILGFLQVFINQVNPDGSLNVTVMNVSGCSNAAAGNPTVAGTSPVPVRLITPP